MKHVMVDLETMGNGPDAAIVALGAVEFDPEFLDEEDGYRFYRGKLGRTFYYNVDLQSSIDAGLTVDASTVYWWLEQSEAARKSLLKERESLYFVLGAFNEFWAAANAENIWAHGASFDVAILKSAYRKVRLKQPFKYNADLDTRSTYNVTGWPTDEEKKLANKLEHNALEDAKAQALLVCNAMHRMRVLRGSTLSEPTLVVPEPVFTNAINSSGGAPMRADLLKIYPDGNFPEGF